MSRDKGVARVGHLNLRSLICWLICQHNTFSTVPARHQTLASLQAFPAGRRCSRYMGLMRQADGLQTFFVDATMQADVDSVSAPSTATTWRTCGACCHAGDQQLLCPVVRPDKQLQSGLLPQSALCHCKRQTFTTSSTSYVLQEIFVEFVAVKAKIWWNNRGSSFFSETRCSVTIIIIITSSTVVVVVVMVAVSVVV